MATDDVTYGMSLCCFLTEQKGPAATDDLSHVCSTHWACVHFKFFAGMYIVSTLNFDKHEASRRNSQTS